MAALAVRMQGRTLKANLSGGPAPKKSKADLEMELIIYMELIKALPEKGFEMLQVEVADHDLVSAAGLLPNCCSTAASSLLLDCCPTISKFAATLMLD
jgi:hypothetical protein